MGRLAVRALAAARKRYGLNGPGVEGLRRRNLAESRSRSFTLIGMSYSFRGSILQRGLKAELPINAARTFIRLANDVESA
jgi:hypothetical protein